MFGAWQATIKATTAQEARVHDSDKLNQRKLLGLLGMEVMSGEKTISEQQRTYSSLDKDTSGKTKASARLASQSALLPFLLKT